MRPGWIGCLLLVTILQAGPAMAEDAHVYCGGRIGHITLEDVDDDGSFNVGLVGGVFFGPGFSAEGSVDFQESDFFIEVDGIQVSTIPLERETIAFQFGLTFTPFPRHAVRPYALGGFGYYFSEYAFGNTYEDDRVSELGWYAGGGIDFLGAGWRDRFSIMVDVRWLFTEKEEPGGSDVRADGRMFSAGLRWKF